MPERIQDLLVEEEKTMFRRSLLPILLVLLLLLAACGGGGAAEEAATPAAESAAAPAGAEAGAEAAPAELSGEVTFWSAYNTVSPETSTLVEEIIPAFNQQYPNVTVTHLALPYEELRQKLLTSIAGGLSPDLVRADIIWVPEFAELGALAKVDELIPDFENYKTRFYEGPLATNFYNGNYYGLPLDTNTRILIYNQALFDEAGITAAPTTVEEFVAACDKIKALNRPETYCYAEGGTDAWNLAPWIWINGGALTDDAYTTATGFLNGEATVQTANMLRDWLNNGLLSPSILGGGLATSEAIANGQAAIIVDGPWMPPIFAEQFPDFQYGMAPMPAGAGGSSSVVGGEDIVLFEASENKEAALAFMQFMLEEEAQLAMGKVGQMPVLKSLSGNPELPDHYAPFQTQLETARPRTPSPEWTKIGEAISNAFQFILRGEQEPQAALDEAAATVDELLASE
jgi:multiple sugar transport system substrate-binding protein